MFVTKYTSSGTKEWTFQLGTSTNPINATTQASSIAVDQSGYIYAAGWTTGNLDSNARTGATDLFFVKLNSSGVKQQTVQFGTTASAIRPNAITTDSSGNVYLTGRSEGSGIDGITQIGITDAFLIKFSSSGVKQWTRTKAVAASNTIGYGINVTSANEVIMCGSAQSAFDGYSFSGAAAFITKLNTAGFQQ
jgi:hypothetical protein